MPRLGNAAGIVDIVDRTAAALDGIRACPRVQPDGAGSKAACQADDIAALGPVHGRNAEESTPPDMATAMVSDAESYSQLPYPYRTIAELRSAGRRCVRLYVILVGTLFTRRQLSAGVQLFPESAPAQIPHPPLILLSQT